MSGLTQQQNRAVEADAKYLALDAGAGSGKTKVLIERILRLLEQRKADLDEIVAITFTEKAAAEMLQRLRIAFRAKASRDDPDAMSFWRRLEQRLEFARISTIHAFCAGILRENAIAFGLDPDFVVATDLETNAIATEVATNVVQRGLREGDEDTHAVCVEYGANEVVRTLTDILVSGRLLIHRIADILPEIAADGMALWHQRLSEATREYLALLGSSEKVRILLHNLQRTQCPSLSSEHAYERRRRWALRVLQSLADAYHPEWVRQQLDDYPTSQRKPKDLSEQEEEKLKLLKDFTRKTKALVEKIRDTLAVTPEDSACAEMTAVFARLLKRACDEYDRALFDAQLITFDGLLLHTAQMLQKHPDICAKIAQRIRYFLLDEFQDTDPLQMAIIRYLCDQPQGPALFFVGDAKQSIYRFRGAEVSLFQEQRQQATECVVMRENFRTVPEVLGFVDNLFQQSGLLDTVEKPYLAMQPKRATHQPSCVEILLTCPEDGVKPTVSWGRHAEARVIAQRIAELCAENSPVRVYDARRGLLRPPKYGDIALLFRSFTDVYAYEDGLREFGIPYETESGKGFFQLQEITDLANVLRWVVNPADRSAFLAVLRSPFVGVSDDTLFHLALQNGGKLSPAMLDSVPDDYPEAEKLRWAHTLRTTLAERVHWPVSQFLRFLVEFTQYEAVLIAQRHGVRRAANVRKLIEITDDQRLEATASLTAFLRHLDQIAEGIVEEGEAPVAPGESNAVTLLTIHKSKGLEFPIVFVCSTNSESVGGKSSNKIFIHPQFGLFASVSTDTKPNHFPTLGRIAKEIAVLEDESEHARLLYVAMTRARDYLVISGALTKENSERSWLGTFERLYALSERKDSTCLRQEGFTVTVHKRRAGRPGMSSSALPLSLAVPPEEQWGPLTAVSQQRSQFTVTEVLDRLGFADVEEAENLTDKFREQASLEIDAGPADSVIVVQGVDISPTVTESSRVLKRIPPKILESAAWRGKLAHALLQRWNFAENRPPEWQRFVKETGIGYTVLREHEEYLKRLMDRFATSAAAKRLSAEIPVFTERSFIWNLGRWSMRGTVDAYTAWGTLVDYKTGAFSEERFQNNRNQIMVYAAAWRVLTGQMPKHVFLYYLDADLMREVPVDAELLDGVCRRLRECL